MARVSSPCVLYPLDRSGHVSQMQRSPAFDQEPHGQDGNATSPPVSEPVSKPASIRSVKGTRDLLPHDTALWQRIEEEARQVFGAYHFGEIRTPILEHTSLFARTVGEDTDIVGKEMYTFEDQSGDSLTLRPEATASVVRAYIERSMSMKAACTNSIISGPCSAATVRRRDATASSTRSAPKFWDRSIRASTSKSSRCCSHFWAD